MCGKDCGREPRLGGKWGSPPHVRERPLASGNMLQIIGITPACAGKTMAGLYKQNYKRDHPRMCGKDYGLIPRQA